MHNSICTFCPYYSPLSVLFWLFFFSLKERQKGFTSCSAAKFSNFLLPPSPKKSSKATVSLTAFTRLCWNTSHVHCWQFSLLWRRALPCFFIPITFQYLFVRNQHSILLQCSVSPAAWPASSAAATESPFQAFSALPVPSWNPIQAHLMRCSMKKPFVEVSSRCVSLLTTAVCHTPALFPHLLQWALALTVYRWKYTPCIPTLKTKDFENNFAINWSPYQQ